MWYCTSCGWSGESDELKPVIVPAGIQGSVVTYTCMKCRETVGDLVIMRDRITEKDTENISQEISVIDAGDDEVPTASEDSGGNDSVPEEPGENDAIQEETVPVTDERKSSVTGKRKSKRYQ